MASGRGSGARPVEPGGPPRSTGYGAVLAVPGMRGLYAVGMLARIPHTAGSIALLLHVTEGLGEGYAAAGVVTAALTVGIAAGSPWRGRLVDRLGLRRALVPSIVAVPLLWVAAAIVPYALLVPVALAAGVLAVPVFTVVRQAIATLLPPTDRRAGYALDSVLVEVSFLVGPPSIIIVVTAVGPRPALVAVGVGAALAGILLAWLDPLERARARRPGPAAGSFPGRSAVDGRSRPGPGAALATVATSGGGDASGEGRGREGPGGEGPGGADTGGADAGGAGPAMAARLPGGGRPARRLRVAPWVSPGVLAMYATAFGAAFVLAGTEVGLLAAMREADRTALVAVLLVLWGTASAVGGLAFGARRGAVPAPPVLLLLLAATTVPLVAAGSPAAFALLLVPAGALIAPTLSSSADGLSRRAPEAVRGEAMGWHGSATTAGFSLGAPTAGLLIDLAGPGLAFAGVAGLACLVAVAGVVLLRGEDAAGRRRSRA